MRTNRNNTGKAWEKTIEIIGIQYASQRLMRFRKIDPPLRYIGGRVLHLANPWLDYGGCWTERQGRMVVFEAKSTKEPRLPLGSGGLTTNQMANMHLWTNAGAVVFLLWECHGRCALWNYQMIVEQGKEWKHLKHENGLPVGQGMGHVIFDFRQVMLKLWP